MARSQVDLRRHLATACVSVTLIAACSGTAREAHGRQDGEPTPAARTGLLAQAVGCYALSTGANFRADGEPFLARARWFRLDSSSVNAEHIEVRVVAGAAADSAITPMSLWTADSLADTVRVVIGDGLTGVELSLDVEGEQLSGLAVAYGDAGPWRQPLGTVIARRIPCAFRQER